MSDVTENTRSYAQDVRPRVSAARADLFKQLFRFLATAGRFPPLSKPSVRLSLLPLISCKGNRSRGGPLRVVPTHPVAQFPPTLAQPRRACGAASATAQLHNPRFVVVF